MPVLPTTPFVLLASFFFSRSSERWHSWLRNNIYFGKTIQHWEATGSIGRRTKITATVAIVVSFGVSIAFFVPVLPGKIGMVVIATAVLIYIWTRPEHS